MYVSRVMEVEQAMFTSLLVTSTGGMGEEYKRFHNRLAELTPYKKLTERVMVEPYHG